MKLSRYALLAAPLVLGLTSCTKTTDPQPGPSVAPAPAHNELERVLYYPASAISAGVSYAPADVNASGRLATELLLSFSSARGQDAITFTLPVARLTADLVGSYALQSQPTPAAGIAQVAYTLTLTGSATSLSGRLYLSNANRLEGQVVLTAYDPHRRLLSGTYTVKLNDIDDPYSSTPSQRCNLTLQGSFANLPLQ
jgi:hypothetical protein